MELISVIIFPSLSSTWQGRANGVRSLSESLLYNLQFQAFRLRANGRNNSPTMLGPAVHRGKDTTHKSL